MPIPKAFASYCHFTNLSRSGVPWCAVLKHESRECFWTRIEYELNGKDKNQENPLPCVRRKGQKPENPLAEDGAAPCCQASTLVL